MRIALRRVGVALASATLALSVVALPAYAEPASLSGTITADDTGASVMGCASAYTADQSYAGGACSDDVGQWTIDGLEAGVDYKIEISTWDGEHVGEWAQDASSFDSASAYTAPATVDVGLAVGGTIQGTLLRADGSSANFAQVLVWDTDVTNQVAYSYTMDDGSFNVLVPPGDYKVEFTDWPLNQWATGKSSPETADVIHVDARGNVTLSDQFLPVTEVSGVIRSDVDGSPIGGVCVDVFYDQAVEYPDYAGGSCTDVDGNYKVVLASAGTFIAHIYDQEGRFVDEYYDNSSDRTGATAFAATPSQPMTIDAGLAPAATISGRAVDAKLGTPVAGACATAYVGHAGSRAHSQMPTCSEADGRWSIGGLPSGSYAIHLSVGSGPSTLGETWAYKAQTQAEADLIAVATGGTKVMRDVKVPSPVTISGRITDPFGQPVEGARVNPTGNLPDRSGECYFCAITDAAGQYSLQVPPGTYRPVAYAPALGFAPVWSGAAGSYEAAVDLTLRAGKTGTFSAQLTPGSTIAGDVVNSDGSPAGPGWIGFVESTTGRHIADLDAYPGNTFGPAVLPAGDFRIRLENAETGQIAWYDGVESAATATVVTVGQGEHKVLTFHLP